MKNIIIIGIVSALATGLAIGIQATLSSRVGDVIGSFRTTISTNLVGGMIGAFLIFLIFATQGTNSLHYSRNIILMLIAAGTLGIFIVMGVSFSLSRIGVTAGLAAIILGQMFVSVIVDTTGWGGVEPIQISLQRIIGLLVMGLAVILLLPQK
ncbi:MAG: DMT family transporter [Anaerolineales bacterium]|nr:DMT family transporter [Anaerolineales bacterium]